MDERERMRAGLAEKAMGWTLLVDYDDFYGYGEPSWFWMGRIQYPQSQWDPFYSWEQCGRVVEAMRAKGWRLELDANTDCVEAVFYLGNDTRGYAALYDTVPEAVSVAACCALEATDD